MLNGMSAFFITPHHSRIGFVNFLPGTIKWMNPDLIKLSMNC